MNEKERKEVREIKTKGEKERERQKERNRDCKSYRVKKKKWECCGGDMKNKTEGKEIDSHIQEDKIRNQQWGRGGC